MNKTQKIILSIVVTLTLFVIAYLCSTSIDRGFTYQKYIKGSISGEFVNTREVEFYELQYNWYVWILFIIVSGGFNFWLYSDKKQSKKNDERD